MRFKSVSFRASIGTALAVTALTGSAFAQQAAAPTNTYPTTNDPRTGLKPGRLDAAVAAKNMRLVSFSRKPAEFDSAQGLTFVNSDLAFRGNYVYAGNFAGFTIWDVSNPAKPVSVKTVPCRTSQGDPSIYGNLLFISAEGGGNRNDCGATQITDPKDHMAGVRIFDVSDPKNPKLVKNVQNCKGSHTHTLIPSPTDKGVVYIYISGGGGARPATEMDGCTANDDPNDVNNVMYRLDIIKVPLANPTASEVIGGARIFADIGPRPQRAGGAGATGRAGGGGAGAGRAGAGDSAGRAGGGRAGGGRGASGPRNCHDVTSYPALNLLAGACSSHGLMVDISNPEKPVRTDYLGDGNFSLWHTAVFSNDGSKVVFTDEWGGGTQPMCQITSAMELGGNTVLTIDDAKKLKQHAYFKIPTAQTDQENCVSHNGGLVPVPGRDLMVQGWYQGGVDVFDFTDPDHPFEIAYFDRGPIDMPRDTVAENAARAAAAAAAAADTTGRGGRGAGGRGGGGRGRGSTTGGSWGAYWYNGYIYSNELDRGFDILELTPSDQLSANEIAAAKLVKFEQYNPQSQPKIVWPAAFPVVRSYLDQLVRGKGLPAARTTAIGNALNAAERATGAARRTALNNLATAVDKDVAAATDKKRVEAMAAAIRDLAKL